MGKMIGNPQFYRLWEDGRYTEALEQSLEPRKSKRERISDFLFGSRTERSTTLAAAGLSVGDFIYDYLRIDPVVVEGINFARAEEIDSIFAFSHFAKNIDADSVGEISQLQGYVAEKMLAMELTAKGHEVQFPETSNEPGWDLLVDGEKFQVKNLSEPRGVYEHLQKYPDIPVYVNADLADTFAGHRNVYIAESIHHEEIVSKTRETIILGQELQDFEIPLVTALASTAINVKGLMKGESNLKHTVLNIVTDTASRSAGGLLGQYTGATVGLMLFGPAGVIVLGAAGAFLGMAQGGKLAGTLKRMTARAEEQRFKRDLTQLLETGRGEIVPKLKRRQQQWLAMKTKLEEAQAPQEVIEYFQKKHQDDQTYLTHKQTELEALKHQLNRLPFHEAYTEVLTQLSLCGIHPRKYQRQLNLCHASLKALLHKLKMKGLPLA